MIQIFLLGLLAHSTHSLTSIGEIIENTIKRIPTQNTTRPLEVRLGFYLESIGNFKSAEMSFDVDMYLYMSWKDHRLRHRSVDQVLVTDDRIRKKLWLPDLYFANAKEAKVHEVTAPNFNIFIDKDGTIAYSCRFTMSISCNLQLRNYPMDVQMCGIRILSYAHIQKQMDVKWFDEGPIRANPEIRLPEFEITNITARYCNGAYRYAVTQNGYKYDNFSCLFGKIFLSRNMGYNLIQSYIPTGLIVVISWVSFWIDRRAVPARVTLSFTTLVSLTTLGNGMRYGLPMVDYAKAIDLWYGACMIFVFLALLEFAIVNSIMRKSDKYDQIAKKIAVAREPEKKEESRKNEDTMPVGGNDWNRKTIRDYLRKNSRDRKLNPQNQKNESPHRPPYLVVYKEPENQDGATEYDSAEETFNDGGNLGNQTDQIREDELEISDDDTKMWNKAMRKDNPNGLIVLPRKRKNKDPQEPCTQASRPNSQLINRGVAESTYAVMSHSFSRRAFHLDQICRYIFPGTFLIFNLWYWIYFLIYHKNILIAEMKDQL
ncbi:unnamed protein product, partial [Mesorhabditis belari]|uniref:Uncharacterized protein n=1 Tax=Mesorhabditis belari TaxID=2138241 RepID=A0AAF3EPS2_9BILA